MAGLNVSFIVRLIDKLSAPSRAMANTLERAEAPAKRVDAAVGAWARTAERAGKQASKSTAPSQSFASTLERAEAPAKRADAAVGAWARTAERAGRQASRSTAPAKDLARALGAINTAARAYSLDPMRRQVMATDFVFRRLPWGVRASTAGLAEFYAGAKKVKDVLKGLPAMIEQTDKMMDRLSNATIVTDGMVRQGRAILQPFEAANKSAADFDRQMTGIGITAGLTDAQLAPVQARIMQLSEDLNMMPTLVLDSFSRVLAEGVFKGTDEINTAAEALVKFQRLASAGGDELNGDDGGALLAGLRVSLNLRADQMERAFAMINQSSKDGGIGNSLVARALPSQLGDLKGFGGANMVGFADLLAANQVAKSKSGQGAAATNNISNLFAALGSAETKKNFSDAGINLENEIRQGLKRGLSPLETVATVVKRKTGGDQFRIAELVGDRQARDGLVALVQNLEDFRDKRDAIMAASNDTSSYGADQARINAGAKSSAEGAAAAQARLAIATGKILAPAFIWAADAVEKLADWLVKLEEGANPIGRILVGVAAGIGVFMTVAGAVGSAIIGLLGPILIVKAALPGLGGLFGGAAGAIMGFVRVAATAMTVMGTALFTNPVGWIILLVAAIAAATYFIVKNWGTVKRWFAQFWAWMSDSPLQFLTGPIGQIAMAASAILKFWEPLKQWFGHLWSGLKAPDVGGWFNAIIAPLSLAWAATKALFSRWWSALKLPDVGGWLAALTAPVAKAWSSAQTYLTKWWSGLKLPELGGWLAALTDPVARAWSSARTYLTKWWSGLKLPELGGWLAALTDPVARAWSSVQTYLSRWWAGLKAPDAGAWFATLTGSLGRAWAAVQGMLTNFWSGLKAPDPAKVGGGLMSVLERAQGGVVAWIGSLGDLVAKTFGAIGNGVQGLLMASGNVVGASIGAAAAVAGKAWQGTSVVIGAVFSAVVGAATLASGSVIGLWQKPPRAVQAAWEPLPNQLDAVFARIVVNSAKAGAAIAGNLGQRPVQGVAAAWTPLVAFFSNLWAGIVREAATALAGLASMIARLRFNGGPLIAGLTEMTAPTDARGSGGPESKGGGVKPPRPPMLAASRGDGGARQSRAGQARAPSLVTNNWHITAPNAPAVARAVARTPQARGRLYD